jgi:hypothetical protein
MYAAPSALTMQKVGIARRPSRMLAVVNVEDASVVDSAAFEAEGPSKVAAAAADPITKESRRLTVLPSWLMDNSERRFEREGVGGCARDSTRGGHNVNILNSRKRSFMVIDPTPRWMNDEWTGCWHEGET